MRRILILVVCNVALTTLGQAPSVMLEVKPVNRKEKLVYSRALAVSVRNFGRVPINEATVQWAVFKEAYDLKFETKGKKAGSDTRNFTVQPTGPPQAFGGEKTVKLAPLQAVSFETEEVKAYEGRFHGDPPLPGDSIVGHGVQVIVGGRVVAESYADPRHKGLLEKIQSPEAGLPEGLKKKKKKK